MVFRVEKRVKSIPTWFWVLFFGVPFIIFARWLFWWFYCPSYKRTASLKIDAPRGGSIEIPDKKDDFRKLKGIGPKTSETLNKAGILTFKQLGLMNPELFMEELRRLALPTTNAAFWQEQARLAAAENWDKLEKLQNK